MKWLQWSYLDVENGLGGVETHMRSLARELRELGVDAQFSSSPDALSGSWDVIHTHGSNLQILTELKARFKKPPQGSPLWVHTLHGLTHERMIACGEYFWPGGYRAIGREVLATLSADVLFAIHPAISLYNILSKTSKACATCGNGWDPWSVEENQNLEVNGLPDQFWLYVGRGDDAMKGTILFRDFFKKNAGMNLVTVPGSGFEKYKDVIRVGPQNPSQVRALLRRTRGLLLPSVYEGLPLVVLEALAEGVPVVTTYAGGLKTLSDRLQGLIRMKEPSVANLTTALDQASQFSVDTEERAARALHNRQFLKTWKDVAQVALRTVNEVISSKNRRS